MYVCSILLHNVIDIKYPMPPKVNRQLLNSIIQGQTERNILDQPKRTGALIYLNVK